jgi:hypothetical protein
MVGNPNPINGPWVFFFFFLSCSDPYRIDSNVFCSALKVSKNYLIKLDFLKKKKIVIIINIFYSEYRN